MKIHKTFYNFENQGSFKAKRLVNAKPAPSGGLDDLMGAPKFTAEQVKEQKSFLNENSVRGGAKDVLMALKTLKNKKGQPRNPKLAKLDLKNPKNAVKLAEAYIKSAQANAMKAVAFVKRVGKAKTKNNPALLAVVDDWAQLVDTKIKNYGATTNIEKS